MSKQARKYRKTPRPRWRPARLREIIRKSELSQSAFAKLIGTPRNNVNGWLNGTAPSVEFFWLICDRLFIDPNALRLPVGSAIKFRKSAK